MPFGVEAGSQYESPQNLELVPGDMLVLITDGFFEWKKEGGGGAESAKKTPYWIHLADKEPFAMAGLWEKWAPGDKEAVFQTTNDFLAVWHLSDTSDATNNGNHLTAHSLTTGPLTRDGLISQAQEFDARGIDIVLLN